VGEAWEIVPGERWKIKRLTDDELSGTQTVEKARRPSARIVLSTSGFQFENAQFD
jgi:hypothetical protein